MVAVSFALGFAPHLHVWLWGWKDATSVERLVQEETTGNIPVSLKWIPVTPIVDVVALADVNDRFQASYAWYLLWNQVKVVYAPADAEVSLAFPTGHALVWNNWWC